MDVDTPILDSEQVVVVERNMRSKRFFGPGLCAAALALVGLGSRVIWTRGVASPSVTDTIVLDLEDREVQIQMDMTGIKYSDFSGTPAWGANGGLAAPTKEKCDLGTSVTYANGAMTTTRELAFKAAVSFVVAKKAQIPFASVVIKEDPSTTATPKRTEFPVTISVPSELTASVLMTRLNDGSTLLKDIQDTLIACHLAQADITVHSVMKKQKGKSVVMETKDNPNIIFEMDIKGLAYKQLGLSEAAKTEFVEAVRTGIVPPGLDVDAASIALDITDGGKNDKLVPFVHVVASIPVPAGISADATMSQWPGGRTNIGTRVTANLKKVPDIISASRVEGSTTEHHEIIVFPGMLRLGGIRSSYATQVRFQVEVHGLTHTAGAGHPTVEQIRDKLKGELKKEVGKDNVEVVFILPATKKDAAEPLSNADRTSLNADPLVMKAVITHGETASVDLKSAAVWETKLIPAVRSTETSLGQTYTAAKTATYAFKMLVPKLSNEVSTVDLDMVVHGIDLETIFSNSESVRQGVKAAFLVDLAAAVRTAINHKAAAPINGVKDDIKVLVSWQSATGALNLRAQIPAPDNDKTVLEALEKSLEVESQDGTLKKHLEDQISTIAGIKYVSTWTPTAIVVSLPGHINDFSGDVVGSSDAL